MIARLILFWLIVALPVSAREWKSVSGAVVQANLVEVKDHSVVLMRTDGKTAEVRFGKLSHNDLVHLLETRTTWAAPPPRLVPMELSKRSIEQLAQAVGRLTLEDFWRMSVDERQRVAAACSRRIPVDPTRLLETLTKFAERRDLDKRREILLGVAVLSIKMDCDIEHRETIVNRTLDENERQQHTGRLNDAVQQYVRVMSR